MIQQDKFMRTYLVTYIISRNQKVTCEIKVGHRQGGRKNRSYDTAQRKKDRKITKNLTADLTIFSK